MLPARTADDRDPTVRLADVSLGPGVRFPGGFVNLYGCAIGEDSRVGAFVEIQRGVTIGARCKISSHTFICEGIQIGDDVFIGHGVMFINDRHPRAAADGVLLTDGDWTLERTIVQAGASIGSNATILGGIEIGAGAAVGAGAVVTKSVPAGTTVVGNPARPLRTSTA